jgi:oxygen-independent coproporphyrinogen-3 oxidase
MNRWLISGRIEAPDPDLAAEQYELAGETLEREGFQHYEISNWSRPGLACQHNLIYWRNGAFLGLGAGAHGHAAGYRYSVVRQPRVYIRRMRSGEPGRFPWSAALAEKRLLSRIDMMADTVITQLRLLDEGIRLDAFEEQFGIDFFGAFPGVNEQLIEWGLLQQSAGRLLLTDRGQFLSNQVFYRFM